MILAALQWTTTVWGTNMLRFLRIIRFVCSSAVVAICVFALLQRSNDARPYGTAGRVPKFLSAAAIGDSNLADNGAGGFDFMTHQLHNVVDPTSATDAATQAYVLAHSGSMAIGGTVTSGTSGSVLFIGAGPVLAQDNAHLNYAPSLIRLNLVQNGADPADGGGYLTAQNLSSSGIVQQTWKDNTSTFRGAFGYSNPANHIFLVKDTSTAGILISDLSGIHNSTHLIDAYETRSGDVPIVVENLSLSGYSGIAWQNSSGTYKGSMGFGNASVTNIGLQSKNFFASSGTDYVFNDVGSSTDEVIIGMTNGSTFVQFANGSSAATAGTGVGRIRYNNTTFRFESSVNGSGSYQPIITGGAIAAPTFGACGTSPSATLPGGHSPDGEQHSTITIGTGGPTSCDVVYAFSYSGTPTCVITGYGAAGAAGLYISVISPTGFTVTSPGGGALTGDKFGFHCDP
jgi:hypothetical protein